MSLTYEEQLEIVNETFRTILLIHDMVIRKKLRKQLEANNTNTFRSDSSNSGSRELALPIPRNPYSPCNELSKEEVEQLKALYERNGPWEIYYPFQEINSSEDANRRETLRKL